MRKLEFNELSVESFATADDVPAASLPPYTEESGPPLCTQNAPCETSRFTCPCG